MRRLARIPRSVEETKLQLRERTIPSEWIERITAELLDKGFLDDRRFAEAFARARSERGFGDARIRKELADKGVGGELIEAALTSARGDFSEKQILRDVLAKRVRSQGKPRTERELKNLSDFLYRRGFSPESIRAELEGFFKEVFRGD